MNRQDLYAIDETVYKQIQEDRKKKELETKAFFDGMEKGADMMRKIISDYLIDEEKKEGADNG